MKALPFFLVIALIVAIVWGIVYLVKKRRQELELLARQLKLDFFSKGYRLLSNQVDDIRDLFQPNLIKFYETNQICTEAIGPYLLVYPFPPKYTNSSLTMGNKTFTRSQYLNPKDVKPYLDLSLKLLSLLEKNMSTVRS